MIGASVPRRDGRAKVLGSTCYAGDKTLPAMLHGVTVRTRVPRGILKGITYGDGLPWDEFTIVTAADIIGQNRVAAMCWTSRSWWASAKRSATRTRRWCCWPTRTGSWRKRPARP